MNTYLISLYNYEMLLEFSTIKQLIYFKNYSHCNKTPSLYLCVLGSAFIYQFEFIIDKNTAIKKECINITIIASCNAATTLQPAGAHWQCLPLSPRLSWEEVLWCMPHQIPCNQLTMDDLKNK